LAAIALAGALLVGFPPLLAAPLAICALVAASGAMHEDGLADCADGFFGGATRDHKLAIMRDSRIGTYGAAALVLSLYLRVASITVIAGQGLWLATTVLAAAAACSRTAALMPLALLPPARETGAGFAAGAPDGKALAAAIFGALLFALAPVVAGASPARALTGITLATGAAFAVTWLAKRQIGGQTGDVAGAAQQLSEIAFYLAFAARV
jgi:adenosylcobinamide-GDP ribazoletransferase